MKIIQFFVPGEMSIFRMVKMEKKRLLFILVQLLFISSSMFAQTGSKMSVSGSITDANGESMIGINILISNTFTGTVTDFDGNYAITAKPSDTLLVSFIGYEKQVIPVNGRAVINIQMNLSDNDLEEYVVVGYGQVKRANVLGAVSSLSAVEIEDIPATNLSELLEGRMPGVSLSPAQPSGMPGASTRIKIRGEQTFGSSGGGDKDHAPLYIVDGFEVSQETFDVMDPSEIESFSVLKDASAAVYGSKGSNGVILIKTKRGKKGKIRVSYSGSVGIMDATMQTEMLSAYDQARMINVGNLEEAVSAEELALLKSSNNDWLDQAWQASSQSRHTINFSGGTEKVSYYVGGAYTRTEGNFPDLGIGKYSTRMGLDAQITDGLSVSATISLDNRDFKRPYLSGTGANTMEGLFQALLQAPKWTPSHIDGLPVSFASGYNPLALFDSESFKRSVNNGNTMNLRASYDFQKISGLKASATYSRRASNGYNKTYQVPYNLYEFLPADGSTYVLGDVVNDVKEITNKNRIDETYSYSDSYQINFSLNYERTFGKHDLSTFATYEQSEGSGYGFGATAENMLINGIQTQRAFDYLSAVSDGNETESGSIAGVFRLNYSYADKYLLETTLRYESTVKFAKGQRGGMFPAAAIGWIISEENFAKENIPFVSFMKLRYSTGLSGFASIGSYEYNLSFAPSGSYLFGGGSALGGMGITGKTDVVSTGVTWEKSFQNNLGLDLKFLKNALSVSLDAYYNYNYDILDNRTVEFPETSGLGVLPSENLGILKAWGYDMSIGYRGKIGKDFKWHVNGIFSFATNKVIERPTQYVPEDPKYPIGQSTFAEGREEGYVTNGIIRTQEQLDEINAEWNDKWGHDYRNGDALLGSLYFQDVGHKGKEEDGEVAGARYLGADGVFDDFYDLVYTERVNDHLVWKNLLPTNASLGATWKGVKVSTLWSFAYGISNKVVDKLARTGPSSTENAPAFWSDFWTPENPDAAYPTPLAHDENRWVSTFWMKDVYSLRLRNLNISYSLPKKITEKLKIPEMRVFFTGKNLWTPISTFDYKEDAISRYNTYPLLRTFSFGLNLKL